MQHLMIDLETLSNRHDAAILSIGAVYFDMETGQIGESFHQSIELESSDEYGHIAPETVSWWIAQEKGAQNSLLKKMEDALPLAHSLLDFLKFAAFDKKPFTINIWAHGAAFDIPILKNAMRRCNIHYPFKYQFERDTRALIDITKQITGYDATIQPRNGLIKHDALSDAVFQAKQMIECYRRLKHGYFNL